MLADVLIHKPVMARARVLSGIIDEHRIFLAHVKNVCSDLIVNEKEDIATVMDLTGHKDIRMLKRYSHTREEAKKSAIEKLGRRLKRFSMDTSMDTSEVKTA